MLLSWCTEPVDIGETLRCPEILPLHEVVELENKAVLSPAGVAQWIEHHPMHRKFTEKQKLY